jgi:hypothetical protein
VFGNSFGGKACFKAFDKSKKQLVWETAPINSTAYMLVYIKTEEISRIVDPIIVSSVPKWVREQEEEIVEDITRKNKLSK